MTVPLVVFGHNTSLTNKTTFSLIGAYSVPSPLQHTSAITPCGPSPPPQVPMTTPPEGEPPSPPPGPGQAGYTCLAGDNSICPGLTLPVPERRAHSFVRPSSGGDVGRGGRTQSRRGSAPTPKRVTRGLERDPQNGCCGTEPSSRRPRKGAGAVGAKELVFS